MLSFKMQSHSLSGKARAKLSRWIGTVLPRTSRMQAPVRASMRGGAGNAMHLKAPSHEAIEAAGAMLGASCAPGDVLHLHGALGAGKTTLCRAFVRSACGDDSLDVPSPTFLLKHTYDAAGGFSVTHVDLYRLSHGPAPARLELPAAASDGALLVEWAERLQTDDVPLERLDVVITADEHDASGMRHLSLLPAAHGRWPQRLAALRQVLSFASDEQTVGLVEASPMFSTNATES